jgi:hypothetical protein
MNFHAFTYGAAVFGGQIYNFEDVEGVTQFAYDYVEDGIHVQGSFTGEEKGDKIVGAWKEQSAKLLNGRTNWQGSATLDVAEHHGRRLLFGVWSCGRDTGRWTIDIAA